MDSDNSSKKRKLIFLSICAVVAAAVIVIFILLSGNAKGFDFYGDSDKDGIINGNDPDANGDGIIDNFGGSGGGGGGGSGGGGYLNINPTGDIDNDGIPNIDDPDIDGDGIPNGSDPDIDGDGVPDNPPIIPPDNDTIIDNSSIPPIMPPSNDTIIDNSSIIPPGNESCDNFRSSMNMDNSYFSVDFSQSACFNLADASCNYGDAFTDNYFWNNALKCCVWRCTFEPEWWLLIILMYDNFINQKFIVSLRQFRVMAP